MDIDEYVVDISKNEGLVEGLSEIDGGITVHHACHARAQNMGIKARDMLKLIPNVKIDVVERCAGHRTRSCGAAGPAAPPRTVPRCCSGPGAQIPPALLELLLGVAELHLLDLPLHLDQLLRICAVFAHLLQVERVLQVVLRQPDRSPHHLHSGRGGGLGGKGG